MKAIFNESDGVKRMTGYATTEYQSDISRQALVDTSDGDLSTIFEDAKADGETLNSADSSIDAAIEDPLAFPDYLVLVNGTIEFDSDYAHPKRDETQA